MRKLASVQKIVALNPIEGADRIELCTVLGWQCIVKKGEFKVNDACIFFEIDSVIPRAPWNDFLADKKNPDKPIRLRSVKMKGQISQGLAMPLGILHSDYIHGYESGYGIEDNVPYYIYHGNKILIYEGADLTEQLGIEKWEPQIPAQLAGIARGNFPSIVPKTDETRIQSEPELLQEVRGIDMYWAIKMDGTSGTFVKHDDIHHVCSRNLSLKETEGNTYWEMYHKYNIGKILDNNPMFAIQGEIAGEGIQKNTAKLKGHNLFVFNIYDIQKGCILGLHDMVKFCMDNGLDYVPLFNVAKFEYNTVEELVEIAKQCKYPCGELGEGYVIRPVVPMFSKVLRGRMSFKVINPLYLIKNDA